MNISKFITPTIFTVSLCLIINTMCVGYRTNDEVLEILERTKTIEEYIKEEIEKADIQNIMWNPNGMPCSACMEGTRPPNHQDGFIMTKPGGTTLVPGDPNTYYPFPELNGPHPKPNGGDKISGKWRGSTFELPVPGAPGPVVNPPTVPQPPAGQPPGAQIGASTMLLCGNPPRPVDPNFRDRPRIPMPSKPATLVYHGKPERPKFPNRCAVCHCDKEKCIHGDIKQINEMTYDFPANPFLSERTYDGLDFVIEVFKGTGCPKTGRQDECLKCHKITKGFQVKDEDKDGQYSLMNGKPQCPYTEQNTNYCDWCHATNISSIESLPDNEGRSPFTGGRPFYPGEYPVPSSYYYNPRGGIVENVVTKPDGPPYRDPYWSPETCAKRHNSGACHAEPIKQKIPEELVALVCLPEPPKPPKEKDDNWVLQRFFDLIGPMKAEAKASGPTMPDKATPSSTFADRWEAFDYFMDNGWGLATKTCWNWWYGRNLDRVIGANPDHVTMEDDPVRCFPCYNIPRVPTPDPVPTEPLPPTYPDGSIIPKFCCEGDPMKTPMWNTYYERTDLRAYVLPFGNPKTIGNPGYSIPGFYTGFRKTPHKKYSLGVNKEVWAKWKKYAKEAFENFKGDADFIPNTITIGPGIDYWKEEARRLRAGLFQGQAQTPSGICLPFGAWFKFKSTPHEQPLPTYVPEGDTNKIFRCFWDCLFPSPNMDPNEYDWESDGCCGSFSKIINVPPGLIPSSKPRAGSRIEYTMDPMKTICFPFSTSKVYPDIDIAPPSDSSSVYSGYSVNSSASNPSKITNARHAIKIVNPPEKGIVFYFPEKACFPWFHKGTVSPAPSTDTTLTEPSPFFNNDFYFSEGSPVKHEVEQVMGSISPGNEHADDLLVDNYLDRPPIPSWTPSTTPNTPHSTPPSPMFKGKTKHEGTICDPTDGLIEITEIKGNIK